MFKTHAAKQRIVNQRITGALNVTLNFFRSSFFIISISFKIYLSIKQAVSDAYKLIIPYITILNNIFLNFLLFINICRAFEPDLKSYNLLLNLYLNCNSLRCAFIVPSKKDIIPIRFHGSNGSSHRPALYFYHNGSTDHHIKLLQKLIIISYPTARFMF